MTEFAHTPFDYWDVLHTVVFLMAVWIAGYLASLIAAPSLLVSLVGALQARSTVYVLRTHDGTTTAL